MMFRMKKAVFPVAVFLIFLFAFGVWGTPLQKKKPASAKKKEGEAFLLYLKGMNLSVQGKYKEAIACFRKAIKLKPDYVKAYFGLGYAYGELGRYQEAIEAYKQAIRLKPDDAEAHFQLGVAYGELGRWSEAVTAFKEAIRLKPDDAEAHYNLGVAYGKLGRWSEAVTPFKQVIREEIRDSKVFSPIMGIRRTRTELERKAWHNLGVVYSKLGHPYEAHKAFGKAAHGFFDLVGTRLVYLDPQDIYFHSVHVDYETVDNELINLIYK
ncbi:MAG: tetratricopeptide repeat protein [Acidobacteria bacterium]|nr:tetratricopeptide repeat protein [Acidobacteriota bacterium]